MSLRVQIRIPTYHSYDYEVSKLLDSVWLGSSLINSFSWYAIVYYDGSPPNLIMAVHDTF